MEELKNLTEEEVAGTSVKEILTGSLLGVATLGIIVGVGVLAFVVVLPLVFGAGIMMLFSM